jgi:lipoyl-dependent peroxiredoxin
MPVRTANAEWKGDLKKGSGTISTESGVLKSVTYNFASRFEEGNYTNPEELVGAAHSACFTMALANNLSNEGFKVNSIKTEDKVYIARVEDGFKITKIEINTVGDVDEIEEDKFKSFAEKTSETCPVSMALSGTEFMLQATLSK